MPWFFCLLAGLAGLGMIARGARGSRRGVVVGIAFVILALVLGIMLWPGRFYAEKMLTDLALPAGVVWFALLLMSSWFAWRHRYREGLLVLLIWMLLSAAGSYATSGWLIESLEAPYLDIDPLDEGDFDVVCLLGGGAHVDRQGRSRLGGAGDRIVVAAALFHAGRTPRVLCTGGDLQPAPNVPTVAQMSAEVLTTLGVPREAILLGPGLNTQTELRGLPSLVARHGWQRVGLVTSAWHMGRAERLAKDAGVAIVPLPADFRTGAEAELPWQDQVRRFSLLPSTGALDGTHAALKEYLARLAGR